MSRLKKIFIFALVGYLLLPTATLAAMCCVCMGGTVYKDIHDSSECGSHGSWGNSCHIAENTACTAFDATASSCCCVCTGGPIYKDIKDSSECGSHGSWGKPCSISCKADCANLDPPVITTDIKEDFKFSDIVLGVKIPNLSFSAPPTEVDSEGNIYLPWIGEYLKAVYNFALVAISIIAVVVLIIQGARIIMSAGGPEKSAAYKGITGAIIGLFIAWGSYVILFSINPDLTQFKALKIKFIEPEEMPLDDPDEQKDPSMGGVALPDAFLNLSKKSGPKMDAITNLPMTGEKVEKCFVIDENEFFKFMTTKFDMSKFSDGSNGACLINLFNSAKVKSFSFLGRSTNVHPSIAEALSKVNEAIIDMDSPIVNYWKKSGRFAMAGSYVNFSEKKKWSGNCKKPTTDTVVVVNSKGEGNRLYTSIARLMYHGKAATKIVGGDMHSLAMATDLYARMNTDSKMKKPLETNIPQEVAEAFMENGFVWGGGQWGRDAMHFEYHNPVCYTKKATVIYPKGNGCCAVIDFAPYMNVEKPKAMPDYASCKSALGGTDASYEDCMGEDGKAGSIWIQQNIQ